jgi:D-alanyl-D-alanine carboxypeptidase
LIIVPRIIGGALAVCWLAAPLSALAAPINDKSPYIVVDVTSGAVLASRQADQPWYPASLTKLVTAYVTFRAIADGKLTPLTKVTQTAAAVAQEPVKMGFDVGTKMSLDNALKMMIVPSANDIAVAIAEAVSGSLGGFVATMNDESARLGMTKSHFENPNGLPAPGEVSSARDLAIVARQILTEFPERRSLFGIQAIQSGDAVYHSPNLMMLERYKGADGMKTGFTCEAGYNLAVTATRSGRTLLAVVLGRTSSSDRAELAARLLDDAFNAKATQTGTAPTLVSFTDPASEAGPIDMRICSGSGVDRVSFTQSVLGPVTVVTDPVKVAIDADPALNAKPAPAKPTAKASAPAKSTGSTGKPATAGTNGTARSGSTTATATKASAPAGPPPDLPDLDHGKGSFKTFTNDE